MTSETVVDIVGKAVELGGIVAAPLLLAGLIVGVLVTLLALVLFGPWMLQLYLDFTRQILLSIPALAR